MGVFKRKKEEIKVNRSGITLDNELRIKAYTGKINHIYVWVVQCILIFCASYCSLFSFVDMFELNIRTGLVLAIAIGAIVANYVSFTLLKIKDISFGAISLVLAYVVFFVWKTDEIGDELMIIVSKYLDQINYNYNLDYMLILNVDNAGNQMLSKIVLIILLFIIMVITYNVVMGMNKVAYFLCTAPWPILSLIAGLNPSAGYFLGYVCVTAIMLYISSTIHTYKLDADVQKTKTNKKTFKDIVMVKVCMSLAIALTVFGIIFSLLFNKAKYEDTPFIKNLSVEMQNLLDRTVARIQGKEVEDSNFSFSELFMERDVLGNGKISEAGSVRFNNTRMFNLVTDRLEDAIYLKNYIGIEYDEGWISKDLDVSDFAFYKIYENLLKDTIVSIDDYRIREALPYHMICVKDLDVEGAVDLIPAAPSVDYNILKDGTLSYHSRQDEMVVTGFEVEYADIYALAVREELLENIDTEDTANMALYSEVPKQLREAIEYVKPEIDKYVNLAVYSSQLENKYGDYGYNLEVIRAVVNYLNYEFEYTLSPGTVPKGMDPVAYFLEYSHRGYCMYYAAAATAILREYGIPTRYVEGYVATVEDMGKSKEVCNTDYTQRINDKESLESDFEFTSIYEYAIKDNSGHAWVEVYLGDIGWVPVEVTSSRLASDKESSINENNLPEPTQEPEQPTETPEATETPAPSEEPKESATPVPSASASATPIPGTKRQKKMFSEEVIVSLFVLIILLTGVLCMVCIKLIKLQRHVDKYKKLITTHKLDYIKEILEYIWMMKGIPYKPTIKYHDYARTVAAEYSKYSIDDIDKLLEILLRDKFSERSVTMKEQKEIIKFYNYVVDDYTKDMKFFEYKKQCLVKKYIQKL